MYKNNEKVEQKCYAVLSHLSSGKSKTYKDYEIYENSLDKEMKESSIQLYYGAYGLHFHFADSIISMFKEFYRIFNITLHNLSNELQKPEIKTMRL